jgi:hypothetical protein
MRIQYSIKSFFGTVLLAGLSLGWWTSSQRFESIQRRHQLLLYDWVQPLEVKNPAAIHYRLLSFRSGKSETWRIYLPHGKKYELQCVYFLSSESSKSQDERVVARIPMSAGRSVFHAEWRRDSQGAPLVRIATLGPTVQDSHFEQAKFPPQFIEAYASSRGLNQTIRGYDGTADYAPIAKLDFVTSMVHFKTLNPSTGEKVIHLSSFEVCIRDVDYKPPKKP